MFIAKNIRKQNRTFRVNTLFPDEKNTILAFFRDLQKTETDQLVPRSKPLNIYSITTITTGWKMKNKEIFKTFFREKPAMMLVELRNAKNEVYASSLAKTIDCTYSHVVKILQEMEQEGLVNFDKQGRLKLLALTKKGHDVAGRIDEIRGLL